MDLNSSEMLVVEGPQFFAAAQTTGTWNANQCLGSGRQANSCHSSVGDASISYTFAGDAITIWGAVQNSLSQYSVAIDGAPSVTYTPSNTTSSRPVVVLALASGLGSGNHNIVITSSPTDNQASIEIDYAVVYDGGSSSSSPATTIGSSSGLSSTTRLIIIIVAIAAGVILILGVVFWMYRKKSRKPAPTTNVAMGGDRKSAESFGSMYNRRPKDVDLHTVDSNQYAPSSIRDVPLQNNPQTTPWHNPNPHFDVADHYGQQYQYEQNQQQNQQYQHYDQNQYGYGGSNQQYR